MKLMDFFRGVSFEMKAVFVWERARERERVIELARISPVL